MPRSLHDEHSAATLEVQLQQLREEQADALQAEVQMLEQELKEAAESNTTLKARVRGMQVSHARGKGVLTETATGDRMLWSSKELSQLHQCTCRTMFVAWRQRTSLWASAAPRWSFSRRNRQRSSSSEYPHAAGIDYAPMCGRALSCRPLASPSFTPGLTTLSSTALIQVPG